MCSLVCVCAGYGEFFIRACVAYDVAAVMKYAKCSLQEAAKQVVARFAELHDKDFEGVLVSVFACVHSAV